ncbi:ATP-binding protein [Streptomyces sp. HNM0574]|uniref:sensor histidine kinase n=1 Tax=Streptomyces sp. HNM0574 TaxID=2714954 RepID=UPI00146D3FED|nr:ATP-binding protein [Streptomyces sp. HNM0574]NLU67099.1 HAMP domain-containing protein [Streptomyces sp. HNM0574]
MSRARRGSVRTRAAIGATAVVAVALIAAGLAVVAVLRSGLADNAKLSAEATAREVAAQVTDVDTAKVRDVDGLDDDEPVQVVDGTGRVLGATDPLRGRGPMARFNLADAPDQDQQDQDQDQDRDRDQDHRNQQDDDEDSDNDSDSSEDGDDSGAREPVEVDRDSEDRDLSFPVDSDGEVTYEQGESEGRQDFSVVAVQSATRDGRPVTVYAGTSLRAQQEAVADVTRAMLIGLPVLLFVVAGVTWLVTRRALQPVEGIRQGMAAITASTDLSRRVPEPAAKDEVARLAATTNETLAALESSTERQRRFVADASHELRSPIASLRTQLEVGAAHPELLDLDGAVQDTVRLQGLAADLLLLARLDAGERPTEGRVSLTALLHEELAQRTADRHPVRITGEGAEGEVAGSKGQLVRVVGNLLDNAQRHAASEVTVAVTRADGTLALTVADDGDGVPEDQRERIFERFVRLDDARSRDDGGAGLGLAIARDIAERHGGTLTVAAAPAGGAAFTLRLPVTGGATEVTDG